MQENSKETAVTVSLSTKILHKTVSLFRFYYFLSVSFLLSGSGSAPNIT